MMGFKFFQTILLAASILLIENVSSVAMQNEDNDETPYSIIACRKLIEHDPDAQRVLSGAMNGNLLRAITSLPAHKEHLINPILMVLRENENLSDPLLFQSKASNINDQSHLNFYKLALSEDISWGHSSSPNTYKNLQDLLKRAEFIYVAHLPSLRTLPLFKVKKLQINYGLYNHSISKSVPRVLNQSNYADIARLLDLNQLTSFTLTSNYDHEPDDVLTIQPFAEAISRQKVLETFPLPRYIGIANLEYLLMNGVAPNKSIKSLSYNQIYGDMSVALMGRMLAENKAITSLYMSCEKLRDLECLNELGRGLEKNTTLQQFTLKIYSLASPQESNPFYVKPPLRVINDLGIVNLDTLKRALILYKGTLDLSNDSHNKDISIIFDAINLEREEIKRREETEKQLVLERSQRESQEENRAENKIAKSSIQVPAVDEGNNLFSRINALKAINLKNEEKIREMTEREKVFNAYKVKISQDLENIKNEKEVLILDLNSLKTLQLEKEKEIEDLKRDRKKLYSLTEEQEITAEAIKEMMKIIGIKTDDFSDCTGNIFANKCLDRLKDMMENI